MAYIVGIDEAGYGPKLGPLVMASVAFSVPQKKTNLRKSLSKVTAPTLREAAGSCKMPVCDSKKIYSPGAGLGRLEQTVHPILLLLKARKNIPASPKFTLPEYLGMLNADTCENFNAYPWYSGIDGEPAVNPDASQYKMLAAFEAELKRQGISFAGAHMEIADALRFNRALTARNKSDFLFELFTKLAGKTIASIRADSGAKEPDIVIFAGKHGGKNYYKNDFAGVYHAEKITAFDESHEKSSYRICADGGPFTVHFLKDGEDREFAIALASMFAKYTRELFMRTFNRFWLDRVPGLKPTAGYPQDAKRFFNDISSLVSEMNIPRETLWRMK